MSLQTGSIRAQDLTAFGTLTHVKLGRGHHRLGTTTYAAVHVAVGVTHRLRVLSSLLTVYNNCMTFGAVTVMKSNCRHSPLLVLDRYSNMGQLLRHDPGGWGGFQ